LRKLHDPDFRVTEAMALAGAQPDRSSAAAWSLGQVLSWLELELVAIELVEVDVPREAMRPPANAAAA